MMTIPDAPLDPSAREWLNFCLFFDTKPGFFTVYERNLTALWATCRKKRGLKTLAYEQTEGMYQHNLQKGRMFPDRDNFQDEYSKFRRGKLHKVRDK